MTATLISAGMRGADYVKPSSLVGGLDTLVADDVRFAWRYIARSSAIGKIITAREVADLADRRILLSLGYQGGVDYHGGIPAGTANGRFARQFAADLGYPDDVPVFVAVDTNITPATRRLAGDYVRAFTDAAANPDGRPAPYSDVDVAREVANLRPYWWRAAAAGWGAVEAGDPPVYIQQHLTNGKNYDPNTALRPVPMWAAWTTEAAWTRPPTAPLNALDRPARVYDTRQLANAKLHTGEVRTVGLIANEVVANVTVVDPEAAGYVTVWGPGPTPPPTSNVNYAAGQTIANLVHTYTDGGLLRIRSTAPCHIVVDLQAAR